MLTLSLTLLACSPVVYSLSEEFVPERAPVVPAEGELVPMEDIALTDVGTCEEWAAPVRTGSLADPTLDEVSGLAASHVNPGVLWVQEDSGNPNWITAIDASGEVLATVVLDDVDNVDWEDLAIGACPEGTCLWVADTGDNEGRRNDVRLLRFAEPVLDVGTARVLHVVPEVLPLRYPKGPQDAEALVVTQDGRAWLLTKRRDLRAEVYAVTEGSDRLTWSGEVATDGEGDAADDARATGATVRADGRLLLRTDARTWSLQLDPVAFSADAEPARVEVPSAAQADVEAVAWAVDGRGYWQVGEGTGADIWFTACAD